MRTLSRAAKQAGRPQSSVDTDERRFRCGFLPLSGSLLLGILITTAAASSANAPGRAAVRVEARNYTAAVRDSDTLRVEIPPGRPLITLLPDSVAGRAIQSYENVRVPALSWRIDRTFFWQTTPNDRGTHAVLFRVVDGGGLIDTLTVLVKVVP